MKFSKSFIVFVLTVSGAVASRLPGQEFVWPTDAGRVMTSSFGEYRSGHFHAGIDIKTWGREGYEIYALADGRVSRISTSPFGYGRAVYLRLDTGETVVYAHLASFNAALEAYVRREQRKSGYYRQNLFVPPGLFRVPAGTVLGYTGSTGNGVPHLHLEIRDSKNRPVNPFHFGLTVEDTRRPDFAAAAVSPLSPESHCAGDFIPAVYECLKIAPGRYRLKEPVAVQGNIGLAVSVTDMADGAWNKFSPYRLRLLIEGREIYRVTYDKVTFAQTGQVDIDRDYWLKSNGKGSFHRLYRAKGNSLPFCLPDTPGAGIIAAGGGPEADLLNQGAEILPAGLHEFEVEAVDFYGNSSRLTGFLRVVSLEEFYADTDTAAAGSEASETGISLSFTAYQNVIRIAAHSEMPWQQPPRLLVKDSPWLKRDLQLFSLDEHTYTARYIVPEDPETMLTVELRSWITGDIRQTVTDTLHIFAIDPEKGGVIRSPDGRCSLRIPPGAVTGAAAGRADQRLMPVPGNPEGTVYELYPRDVLFHQRGLLEMQLPATGMSREKTGLYSLGPSGKAYFAAALDSGAPVIRVPALPGAFTILQDTVPPSIESVTPAEGQTVAAVRPVIEFTFSDDLSGFEGEDDYQVYLNDERQVVEYVPVDNLGKVLTADTLAAGSHVLRISLRDRAGNTAERTVNFIVNGRHSQLK